VLRPREHPHEQGERDHVEVVQQGVVQEHPVLRACKVGGL
jgi:hypothetical protein